MWDSTHRPEALFISPPSSSGIVGFGPRLVPPTWTVDPGNWEVTFSLTPESTAGVGGWMGSEGSQVELREQEVDEEGRRSEKDRSEGRWSEEGRGEEGEGSVNSTRSAMQEHDSPMGGYDPILYPSYRACSTE